MDCAENVAIIVRDNDFSDVIGSFFTGTKLPWDPKYVIDALSDASISMCYYTVAHLLQYSPYDTSKSGPLGIRLVVTCILFLSISGILDSFNQYCLVYCCRLQISHVSFSFPLLSLSDRIVSSQSIPLDRRRIFVLVSLFLVCLPVFLLLFSAEYHNVPMCFSLCGPHKTTFCFSGCLP